jgi:uncharacterized heparinase superfamily protein
MLDASSSPDQRATALRAEALAICERFAWPPQCIGSDEFELGAREIYAELRCLQKVRAVDVSEALIDCCRRHQQWLALFEDVEARIWLFRGERERAEQRWQGLLHHPNVVMRQIAEKALNNLQREVESGQRLVTEVAQALDRGQFERVDDFLTAAIVEIKDLEKPWLKNVLEATALKRSMPRHFPWDRGLYTHQLMLDLFERQLDQWEGDDHG